jgi:hypothetical protein
MDEVFVYMTDETHCLALKELKTFFVNEHKLVVRDGKWYGCSVKTEVNLLTASRGELVGIPASLKLNNLLRVGRYPVRYLQQLVRIFEDEVGPKFTGLTLLYDNKKLLTRPFGFASFSERGAMIRFHGKRLELRAHEFECVSSVVTPVVVSENNREHLAKGTLTNDLKMANWLFGTADDICLGTVDMQEITKESDKQLSAPARNEASQGESDKDSVLSLDYQSDLE